MYFTSSQVHSLDESQLRSFLNLRISEDHYLDYKENFSKDETSQKDGNFEFLKDVTSFANGHGGDIIIGVKDPTTLENPEDSLIGISNEGNIKQSLEQLTFNSIDPRITGLIIKDVILANGKMVLIIHIPSSYTRPHMLKHKKNRTFFIRHSESSIPMTTHEIKELVLQSASYDFRAKDYLNKIENDIRAYDLGATCPVFIFQAIPLIPIENEIDVYSNGIKNIIRGSNAERLKKYFVGGSEDYSLQSSCSIPSLEGIMGYETKNNPRWKTAIHRNGYIHAIFYELTKDNAAFGHGYNFYGGHLKLFQSFCDFCNEIINIAKIDLPYLMRFKIIRARGAILLVEDKRSNGHSDPFIKPDLVFPDHIRQVGDDFKAIADIWFTELHNAFGYEKAPS